MFNLQIDAPRFWQKWNWEVSAGFNDIKTGEVFKGHLFYLLAAFFGTVLSHAALIVGSQLLSFGLHQGGWETWKKTNRALGSVGCAYPQVEVNAALLAALGMLDVSSDVLVSNDAAYGWRFVAAIEVVAVLFMVGWFLKLNIDFGDKFEPTSMPSAGFKRIFFPGLNTSHSWSEIKDKTNADSSTDRPCFFNKCFFTLSPPTDHVFLLEDFFNKFTPKHKYYYVAEQLSRNALEVFFLNGLAPYPTMQAFFLFFIELCYLIPVLWELPFSLLAQSRIEVVSAVGRCVLYLGPVLIVTGCMSAPDAANMVVAVQLFTFFHCILTQIWILFLRCTKKQKTKEKENQIKVKKVKNQMEMKALGATI